MSFASIEELRAGAGADLGYGAWIEIDQRRIDMFAAATGDDQWIHTDPVRAATGPFKTTIAHGYFTLALLSVILRECLNVSGVRMAVNYGLNKVRFPAPLPVDSRVRGHVEIIGVDDIPGGVQVVTRVTIERDGGDKPVCVAEAVARLYS